LPTYELDRHALSDGISLAELATNAGLTSSRGEAKRLAQGKGLRVNGAVAGPLDIITPDDLEDGVILLAAGKKKIVLVKPV
jgi:tyrosyl-tRNA synthetase